MFVRALAVVVEGASACRTGAFTATEAFMARSVEASAASKAALAALARTGGHGLVLPETVAEDMPPGGWDAAFEPDPRTLAFAHDATMRLAAEVLLDVTGRPLAAIERVRALRRRGRDHVAASVRDAARRPKKRR